MDSGDFGQRFAQIAQVFGKRFGALTGTCIGLRLSRTTCAGRLYPENPCRQWRGPCLGLRISTSRTASPSSLVSLLLWERVPKGLFSAGRYAALAPFSLVSIWEFVAPFRVLALGYACRTLRALPLPRLRFTTPVVINKVGTLTSF